MKTPKFLAPSQDFESQVVKQWKGQWIRSTSTAQIEEQTLTSESTIHFTIRIISLSHPNKAMIEVCEPLLPYRGYPHLKTNQYEIAATLPPLWCDRGSGRLSNPRAPKIRAILNRLIEWT